MMSWTNICVEGFCFGGKDENGNYPCGRSCPSHLCLENGHCPHFAYAKTTERQVAHYPPLHLILWDRLGIWGEEIYGKLMWYLWDWLPFNQRKVRERLNSISSISSKECPALAEIEKEKAEAASKFPEWFEVAKVNHPQ